MKSNIGRRTAPATPVLAIVALLLAIGVVGTTPWVFAKYTASATVSASGKVAKWNTYYYTETATPGGLWSPGSTAYRPDGSHEGPGNYNFCVFGNSEVAANVKLEIRYETSNGTVLPAAVTESSPLFASISVTDTTYSHGLNRATLGYNGWGDGGATRLGPFEFEFKPTSPNTTHEWNGISTQATTPAPSGTTINNCMRSYKVFIKAEQKD